MDRDDAHPPPPPPRLPSPRHHPPPAAAHHHHAAAIASNGHAAAHVAHPVQHGAHLLVHPLAAATVAAPLPPPSPHASSSARATTPSSATATDDDMDNDDASIAHPDDATPPPPAKRARHHRSALDSLPAALAHARTLADYLSPLPESAASHPAVRAAADELEVLIPHITDTFATAPALRVRSADVRAWIGVLQESLSVTAFDAAAADIVMDVAAVVEQLVRDVGAVDVAYVWAIMLLDVAQMRVEEQAEWMSDAEWCLVRAVDWVHWILHAESDGDWLVVRTCAVVDRLLTLETTLHNDVLTLPSSTRPYLLHLILSLLHHTWYTAHRPAAHCAPFQHHWASTLKLLATDTDDLDLAHAALQRARMAVLLRTRPPASPSLDDHLLLRAVRAARRQTRAIRDCGPRTNYAGAVPAGRDGPGAV
ncbi:hypothetical protein AMAG_07857 [Allomyces macrogynus ATCC 38327]|uniref:Uncharacterized protein n=1 Tax=Allomyces macrogynus (strain ATCC 38327) TaxID=578462 RepID=A0A0L0SJQ8_ALLM3|nr:hypothetical protein AMAG_07857 [Allomyces macrogynus ATCC 38327]|eukprot:KNE62664.1 hypothetical protein AMAG_07857 [Allomyces macrogynus ATCC 38327]